MSSWFEHSYWREGDTAAQVQARFASLVDELGLDWFSYVLIRPPGGQAVDFASTAFANYPAEWIDRYLQGRYQLLDPALELAAGSNRPFFWGHGCYLRAISKRQRRFYDESRAFGIDNGLAIPVHGPEGVVGMFTVAADRAKRIHDAVGGEHERLFAAAFDAQDFALDVAAGAQEREASAPPLSVREKECLLWTAEGKTAKEIAAILGLSVSTVNHHVCRAAQKMNCVNKYHAAIRALRDGLV